jgi:hypothetical protein
VRKIACTLWYFQQYTHLKINAEHSEGVFLDVIGKKSLRFLLHAIHSHLRQLIVPGFIGLEISIATAERRWGLGFVFFISFFNL